MVIALILDFDNKVENLRREGLFVHCRFLLESLLKRYADFRVEFWTYSYNNDEVFMAFSNLTVLYTSRISFFDESVYRSIPNGQIYRLPLARRIKATVNTILYFVFRKDRYYKARNIHLRKRFCPNKPLLQKTLYRAFHMRSEADAIYVPGVMFELATRIKLPKVVAIHDLFTLSHYELFFKEARWVEEHNAKLLPILSSYSFDGAIFVCSTEYIAEQHIRRYIPSVRADQVKVIPFPPLIKRLSVVAIDKSILLKNLPREFIFYPTQIRANKNILLLIKACQHLYYEFGIKLPLVITGNIASSTQISEYIAHEKINDLVFEVGPLSDDELASCYQHSTVVVVPTIIEGMGISGQCLEALYIGNVPVVHALSDGIDESLNSVGLSRNTADLNWFDYNDHVQCAENIRLAYLDREGTIKKQKGIISRYMELSWDVVAEKYYALFTKVIKP